MSIAGWTLVFVVGSFALYSTIAIASRVQTTSGFYVAGRGVSAVANGMATGADWMSAASFISMAGLISFMGYDGAIYLMGWTGGYVLLALLVAPYLRRYGRYTIPEFVGDRFASHAARMTAVVCAVFISFTYVAGQMRGVGVVFSRFLTIPVEYGVVIGRGHRAALRDARGHAGDHLHPGGPVLRAHRCVPHPRRRHLLDDDRQPDPRRSGSAPR